MNTEAHLETLAKKHGDLEEELHTALSHPSMDDRLIMELKRRKLRIKDQIERIRSAVH
jgi:hypothetical protein